MMLFLALLACNDPCSAGNDPTMDIGWGFDRYNPASEGEEVDLVYGQQGGFHVDLAVSTTELDMSDLVSGTFTGRLDGESVAEAQPWFSLVCEDDAQQSWGIRLIFWELLPPDLDGQTIEVEGTVRDARGTEATGSKSFLVNDPL
ncbi:MAG: hypothetical protein H6737_00145 [Alphaproteobacteria bacterium]|nr:hypothetical protein [Alphaproteobacteria bacterium]